jgi:hydroxyacyl-ACP dehydratase HTD2-like protein with hotdog domain
MIDERIAKDNEDNFSIIKQDTNLVGIIYQSKTMKELYAKHGHILFVDSTYKLNRNNYPCLVMAVRDNNNKARIVAVGFLAYERKVLLRQALKHFEDQNENYMKQTQTIMIDKDLKEDDVLQEFFPKAQILYCHFHVKCIFNR